VDDLYSCPTKKYFRSQRPNHDIPLVRDRLCSQQAKVCQSLSSDVSILAGGGATLHDHEKKKPAQPRVSANLVVVLVVPNTATCKPYLSLSLSLSHFPPLICESQGQERNTSFPFSFPSTRRLIFVCLPLNINQQEPRRLQNKDFAAVQQPNDHFFSPHCIYIFHGFVQYYLGT